MVKSLTRLVALAGLMVLAACQSTMKSDVLRFHHMSGPVAGESVYVVPKDAKKQGGLEFEAYAAQVRAQLAATGYRIAASKDEASIIARLDYKVSEPNEKVTTRPSFGGAGPNPWGRFMGGYYDPYANFPGFERQEVYSVTIYARYLELDLVRAGDKGETLFEGKVESIGTQNSLVEVMPYLVQALFTGFPGESGVTKRVSIKLPKK